MSELDLAAIAERYHRALDAKKGKGDMDADGIAAITDSVCDVPELLAEVRSLRDEIGRVQSVERLIENARLMAEGSTLSFPEMIVAFAGLLRLGYDSDATQDRVNRARRIAAEMCDMQRRRSTRREGARILAVLNEGMPKIEFVDDLEERGRQLRGLYAYSQIPLRPVHAFVVGGTS